MSCVRRPPHWPALGVENRRGSTGIWWPSSQWGDYPRAPYAYSLWSHTSRKRKHSYQPRPRHQFENYHDYVSFSSDAAQLYRCRNRRWWLPGMATGNRLGKVFSLSICPPFWVLCMRRSPHRGPSHPRCPRWVAADKDNVLLVYKYILRAGREHSPAGEKTQPKRRPAVALWISACRFVSICCGKRWVCTWRGSHIDYLVFIMTDPWPTCWV